MTAVVEEDVTVSDAGEGVIVERAARKARKPRAKKLHPAEKYLEDIRDGKVVTSKYVKMAVDRHFRDMEDGHKRGLYFDRDAALHFIDFFEEFLQHTEVGFARDGECGECLARRDGLRLDLLQDARKAGRVLLRVSDELRQRREERGLSRARRAGLQLVEMFYSQRLRRR